MTRPPALPHPDDFSPEDREEYDFVYNRVTRLAGRPVEENPYVCACLNAPTFAASLWRFSGRMLAAGSTGKTFSQLDREHINVVLAFDFGHYEMVEFHLGYAVEVAGLRREMVEAIWDGREEDLTPGERQLVDYIRAYVNGTVTNEMWSGIADRFGGERGAVEYTLTIGYNLMVIRGMQAFGTPTASREQMEARVRALRDGGEGNRYRYQEHERVLKELATEKI
jgi:hypothetical protein